jgi:hypothetical protein
MGEALFVSVAKVLSASKTVVDFVHLAGQGRVRMAKEDGEALGCGLSGRAGVCSGDVGAKNAALSIMVETQRSIRARVKRVPGDGQNITLVKRQWRQPDLKVANQIVVALTTINARWRRPAVRHQGRNRPGKVRQALMGGHRPRVLNPGAIAWSSALSTPVFLLTRGT